MNQADVLLDQLNQALGNVQAAISLVNSLTAAGIQAGTPAFVPSDWPTPMTQLVSASAAVVANLTLNYDLTAPLPPLPGP